MGRIYVSRKDLRPIYVPILQADGSEIYEVRMIDGHVARLRYSPPGPAYDELLSISVHIFDADTGFEYGIWGLDPSVSGSNVVPVIAIARSLLPTDGAP